MESLAEQSIQEGGWLGFFGAVCGAGARPRDRQSACPWHLTSQLFPKGSKYSYTDV